MHLKIDTVLIADTVTKTETVSVSTGLTLPEAKITQMSGKYHLKLHLSGCANDKLTTVSSKLFVLNRRRKKTLLTECVDFSVKIVDGDKFILCVLANCLPTPEPFSIHIV